MAAHNPYGYAPYYGGNKEYMLSTSHGASGHHGRRSRSPYSEVQSHYRPLFSARGTAGRGDQGRTVAGGRQQSAESRDGAGASAISIYVFRNGDAVEPAVEVRVSNKLFRTWLVFLDHITEKVDSAKPVHWLYSMHGRPIDDFRQLRDTEHYVAAHTKPFKRLDYDQSGRKDWDKKHMHIDYKEPSNLNSDESLRLYQSIRSYEHKHVPHRPLVEHFARGGRKTPSTESDSGGGGAGRRHRRSNSDHSRRGARRTSSSDEGGYYSSPSPMRHKGRQATRRARRRAQARAASTGHGRSAAPQHHRHQQQQREHRRTTPSTAASSNHKQTYGNGRRRRQT